MNVEAEIGDLKRRVGELEGSFGFVTEQVRHVHKDLLAFEAKTEQRFDKIDGRLDKLDNRQDRFEGRLDRVEVELKGLRRDLPGIVGDAVREANRERDKKR